MHLSGRDEVRTGSQNPGRGPAGRERAEPLDQNKGVCGVLWQDFKWQDRAYLQLASKVRQRPVDLQYSAVRSPQARSDQRAWRPVPNSLEDALGRRIGIVRGPVLRIGLEIIITMLLQCSFFFFKVSQLYWKGGIYSILQVRKLSLKRGLSSRPSGHVVNARTGITLKMSNSETFALNLYTVL